MTLANADSKEFFAATAEGRLILQKCGDCGAVQFPPRHHCASCWEANMTWVESTGRGTVETFTIVRRAPLPKYRDEVPYVVASVLVEEGPRFITRIEGDTALDVQIGDPVTVAFDDTAEEDQLPVFWRA